MKFLSYHFMMSESEMLQLKELKKEIGIKKNSQMMEYIFDNCFKILKTVFKQSGNHKSKRPEIKHRNIDLRIRINKKYYKYIKLIHGSKNIYSIAVLIRFFIEFFHRGVEKYGSIKEFLKILKKLNQKNKNVFINFLKKIHMDKKYTVNLCFMNNFLLHLKEFLKC